MSTRYMAAIALLLAIAVIGAQIHLWGTVSLDALPAFLGALLLGPRVGAFLGAVGHGIVAAVTGFPLSLPVHLIIMVIMALSCFFCGYIAHKLQYKIGGLVLGCIVAYVINVPLALVALAPIIGKAVAVMLFIPLTIGAAVNLVAAAVLYRAVKPWTYKLLGGTRAI